MAEILTRTPLAGYAKRFAESALQIAEEHPGRQWRLHVEPGRAAQEWPSANRASLGEPTVVWQGPTEFLVLGDWEPARGVTAVDVSDQRTGIRIRGPLARVALASGCAVDLHPRSVRRGDAFTTLIAQCGATVVVLDPGPADGGFDAELDALLLVRSSFARSLADWLLDSVL